MAPLSNAEKQARFRAKRTETIAQLQQTVLEQARQIEAHKETIARLQDRLLGLAAVIADQRQATPEAPPKRGRHNQV